MKVKTMALGWVIFTPISFSLALLSLQVRDVWSLSSLVWFSGGLLQGILLALTPRHWLLWLATGLLVHLIASQLYQRPVSVSLIFSLFDALIMMMTALIWQFFYGAMTAPKSLRQIAVLITLCALSGIVERFITRWSLFLLDYPIDTTVSLLNIVGYVLSYLPLTFFVVYLITLKERRPLGSTFVVLCVAALVAMALLFTGDRSAGDGIHWQNLALWLSFCLPMLLALSGDLLILSAFLSLCAIGGVGAAIYGVGPFVNPQVNLQQSVQMAAWYNAALAVPTLLCCGYVSVLIQRMDHGKMRFVLLKAALGANRLSQFTLSANQQLDWREGHRWRTVAQLPATWAQLLAWIHYDDRPAVEALMHDASRSPRSLNVRMADGEGGMTPATIALSLVGDEPGCGIVGVINEVAAATGQEDS
ncbi:Uncharacterised protein [Serratia ficaria]|uniref:hypothetical protein n=1 Tax=Serratia ficaria TaxID=61651 RepID=UPI00217B09AB|nr:hypothetical protein [Serratia ficaria]CAI1712224.1 Uncharacterised protein [Serratia ficaria]